MAVRRLLKPRYPLAFAGLLLLGGLPAVQAQYKVVGPDGKITYTDRPTVGEAGGQIQPLRRNGSTAAAAPNAALPAELRPLATRFPVILYTSSDCPPCDNGRRLLQQRGVPYAERLVISDDDVAALQRLTSGRTVPALTVGAQALRGFQEADWQSTLDLAGYPKESKLPRTWQVPAPTPLVARNSAEPLIAPPPPAPPPPPPESSGLPQPGGIRF